MLLVKGVGIGSCGLVHATEGGARREVQIEEDLVVNSGGSMSSVPRVFTRGRLNPAECWVLSRGQHLSRSADRALRCSK